MVACSDDDFSKSNGIVRYCTLVLGFLIIVRRCSDEKCKINLMILCIGCLLCSVAEIWHFLRGHFSR